MGTEGIWYGMTSLKLMLLMELRLDVAVVRYTNNKHSKYLKFYLHIHLPEINNKMSQ